VPPHPQQLGRGEARHGGIAGDRARPGLNALELFAFGGRPPVVPQDGRPQHVVAGVQQRRPMHLPRQPDGTNLGAQIGRKRVDGTACRPPPRLGILLGPERVRPLYCERRLRFGRYPVVLAQQQRFDGRRTDVEPEIHGLPYRIRSARSSAS
jgi:hypothetical protein